MIIPGGRHFYIATVQTDEAALICSCVFLRFTWGLYCAQIWMVKTKIPSRRFYIKEDNYFHWKFQNNYPHETLEKPSSNSALKSCHARTSSVVRVNCLGAQYTYAWSKRGRNYSSTLLREVIIVYMEVHCCIIMTPCDKQVLSNKQVWLGFRHHLNLWGYEQVIRIKVCSYLSLCDDPVDNILSIL